MYIDHFDGDVIHRFYIPVMDIMITDSNLNKELSVLHLKLSSIIDRLCQQFPVCHITDSAVGE